MTYFYRLNHFNFQADLGLGDSPALGQILKAAS